MNNMLVVLYKTNLKQSSTFNSILQYLESVEIDSHCEHTLTVWNNSPDNNNDKYLDEVKTRFPGLRINYICTPENTCLSKVYNKISSRIHENEYLTIFDQDTVLPKAYFRKLLEAQKYNYPLILPKVRCNDIIISPGKRFIAKGRLLSDVKSGIMHSRNMLAINSGMSIAERVYNKIQYDERLRFYGTDTYFMYQYEIYYKSFFVLDCIVEHSLAEIENISKEWHKEHIAERLRTFNIIFSNNIIEKAYVKLYSRFIKVKFKLTNI